jgi:predicted aminopeptidase
MPKRPPMSRRVKWMGLGLFCLLAAVCFSGCEEVHFYGQAVKGQVQILTHEKSVNKLMADPATPEKLRVKLEEVNDIREFAARELKLPADTAYLKYVDLQRPYVVWNVNVAPSLSLAPKEWWFPIVGLASYRGYFDETNARRYASIWEKKGWDVYVDGVDAYSTLGFFRDPLLNTFIDEPEWDLADLIFHELAHRRLFVPGDTDFNEAFATEVAAEGVRRWYAASTNAQAYEKYRASRDREQKFVQLVMDTRTELEGLYANPRLSNAEKLQRKEEIIAALRGRYAAVKKAWGGNKGYDDWFSEPINNAKLNTVSAYYDLTPAFAALLRAEDGDMEKFYGAVAGLAKHSVQRRHELLRAYLTARAHGQKSH